MRNWEKKGLVFAAREVLGSPWTHAQLPVSSYIGHDIFRIFFASRDVNQCSHIHFVDMRFENGCEIVAVGENPVLSPGELGCFDEHGVYPASMIRHGDMFYLYYIGWVRGETPPMFYASIGLAVSKDGLNFSRLSKAPIMARSEFDPCLVTSPFVLDDHGRFRMYYVSGLKWFKDEKGLHSNYHIKYAESSDGIQWKRDGLVSVDFVHPGENNIARVCVQPGETCFRMWYCYAGERHPYRLGYAESSDGVVFERKDDQIGVALGMENEFDSEMMCYPHVFQHNGYEYMLYNGNRFGKAGFGLAMRELMVDQ